MYRILLVDDDQNIVDGLGSIIKQNFENIFVISSACDGSDALKRLTEDYYHVIISDIRMPKLDGISLLELISKNQIPSVVIMLSGYDDYTYIRNALRLGAYDYLLKPVNIQNFVSMLRLLIPRLKDSSVKLQAEEVSCVRPETQGDYFDIPAKEPYYTKEDLEKEMEYLSAGLLSMDEEGTKDKIQEIFSHLSQEAVTKEQFKQVFSTFLYTLMQKNTTLIPIIAGYKLSDNDLAAQIKNQPHISQLKQKMEQILLLYMEQLKKQQEKKEEYVITSVGRLTGRTKRQHLLIEAFALLAEDFPQWKVNFWGADYDRAYVISSSLFKKQLDMTVRDYILQLRMTKAKELMKDSSLKLLDIALAVGYEDAAHFNRAFKNVTGVSPSMYRDGIKKS